MTSLLLIFALQAAPAIAPIAPAPAEPQSTPAQTLEGLEQVYATTCGQVGILYHAYDDLCDGLNRQIHAYRVKLDKGAAKARTNPTGPAKP